MIITFPNIMINLYKILHLPPHANEAEILNALHQTRHRLDKQMTKAIHEWLLRPDVRQRYDAQLQQSEPQFFPEESIYSTEEIPPAEYEVDESEAEEDYENLPPLWQPSVAIWWSIPFSCLFGALIHARNWAALGEKKLALKNQLFAIIFFAIATTLAVLDIRTVQLLPLGLPIWYALLARKQLAYFKEHFENGYETREWFMPIVWCVSSIIMWFIMLIIVH